MLVGDRSADGAPINAEAGNWARLLRVCTTRIACMPQMRIRDAAAFLGVSDDTVRRWIDSGSLSPADDEVGRKVIDGYELAQFARSQARRHRTRGSGQLRAQPVRRPGHRHPATR